MSKPSKVELTKDELAQLLILVSVNASALLNASFNPVVRSAVAKAAAGIPVEWNGDLWRVNVDLIVNVED